MQATCSSGVEWNYATGRAVTSGGSTVPLYDYAPIAGAYAELPGGQRTLGKRGEAEVSA